MGSNCHALFEIFTEVDKLTYPTFKVIEKDLSNSFSTLISQKVTKKASEGGD